MPNTTAAAAPASRLTPDASPDSFTVRIPRIGALLAGGVAHGIVFKDDGAPDYILISGPIAPKAMKWNDAMKWAAALDHDGHHGLSGAGSAVGNWALPSRTDQRVQICNAQKEFNNDWFWSCEPYAGNESCAWYQGFAYGHQGYYRKDFKLRARAVRRLPI